MKKVQSFGNRPKTSETSEGKQIFSDSKLRQVPMTCLHNYIRLNTTPCCDIEDKKQAAVLKNFGYTKLFEWEKNVTHTKEINTPYKQIEKKSFN